MGNKRWSAKENRDLLQVIKANSYNLSKSFKMFNQKYPNRSVRAACQHWYTYLRHNSSCFAIVGESSAALNSKNFTKTQYKPAKTLWNRIKDLFRKK